MTFSQASINPPNDWRYTTYKPEYTVGDVGYSTLSNAITTLNALGTNVTLIVPAGTHTISSDITINATVHVKVLNGADIQIGSTALTGTIANTWSSSAGTVTVVAGSRTVSGLTGATIGNRFRTASGNIYMSRGGTYVYETPTNAEAGVAATWESSTITTAAGFNTDALVRGDFIYVGSETLVVASKTNDTTALVMYPPTAPFTATAATRGVRLNIMGPLTAGPYQIFSGDGVARINHRQEIMPEWWGAVADGTTAGTTNSPAFRKAAFAAAGYYIGGTIRCQPGVYKISSFLPMCPGLSYVGSGAGEAGYMGGTSFLADSVAGFTSPMMMLDAVNSYLGLMGFVVRNINFDGNQTYPLYSNHRISGIVLRTVNEGSIDRCRFAYLNWGVWQAGVTSEVSVRNCKVYSCYNGFNAPSDGWLTDNEVACGGDIVTNGTFDTNDLTGWTGTNWSGATGAAVHTAGVGNTQSLYQTYNKEQLREGEYYWFKFTLTRAAGTVTHYFCGTNPDSVGSLSVSGTYIYLIAPTDVLDPTVKFTPSADFEGSIDDVVIYSGIGISMGAGNRISGNIVFGDSGGAIGLYSYSISNTVVNNRFAPFGASVVFRGGCGSLTGNDLSNSFLYGMYWSTSSAESVISNNLIHDIGYQGIGYGSGGPNGIIRDNDFTDTTMPSYVTGTQSAALLMENNGAVDIMCATFPTLRVNNATPPVGLGCNYITANTNPTIITNFTDGCVGKQIFIQINDTNTTFDFSGSNLKGNGGVDYTGAVGESLFATYDGTNWHCIISKIS